MDKLTIFDQIMKLIDQDFLEKHITETETDKWGKVFKTRDHLAVMIFAQLMGCKSLREVEVQFNTMRNEKYAAVRRSTLADANILRNNQVFERICTSLIHTQGPEIREVVRILDSTPIIISGRGTEWVLEKTIPRISGLKVHIRFAPQAEKMDQIVITPPNVNDINVARTWDIIPGTISIFDKGYLDFNWWYKIHARGAYFVTRLKKNTAYTVIEENKRCESTPEAVISDQFIRLSNKHPRGGKTNRLAGKRLRLVTYCDPVHKKTYKFVTNLLTALPEEIASYYKTRWEIELFFKWLKQNLKIKHFLGQNENAIKIQIYTALIAYVLLQGLKKLFYTGFTRMKDFLAWVKMVVCFSAETLSFRLPQIPTLSNFYVKESS